jgi:ubiquinone biosynthesis protein Coq4
MVRNIANTMTRAFTPPDKDSHTGSLAKTRRSMEMKRINSENQRMVDRIAELKPAYETKAFLQDYDLKQRHMVNCSYSLRKVCEQKLKEFNRLKKTLTTTSDKQQFVQARPRMTTIDLDRVRAPHVIEH